MECDIDGGVQFTSYNLQSRNDTGAIRKGMEKGI